MWRRGAGGAGPGGNVNGVSVVNYADFGAEYAVSVCVNGLQWVSSPPDFARRSRRESDSNSRERRFDGTRDTIEIPRLRVKYSGHETGRLRLDRVLFTSCSTPTAYGYFENTLGEDGDPLDAMLILDADVVPRRAGWSPARSQCST